MPARPSVGILKLRGSTILWANQSAHRMLGYAERSLAGSGLERLLAPGPGAEHAPRHALLEPLQRPRRSEAVALQVRDGSVVLADLCAEPMEDDCTLWSFTCTAEPEPASVPPGRRALRRSFRNTIAGALAREEFFLVYQPKVDMRAGKVTGVEALVRWQHPVRGLLQPAMFVPAIEDDPLVEDLGDWALGAAIAQAAAWRAHGLEISVSVNISPRHLLRDDFIDRLKQHLGRHPQLQPGVLELEILETTAIRDLDAVARFIEVCAGLGVPVAMDDFGTGYSSMTYLRQLPVTTVKIDQSFVGGMLDDPEDRAIVEGILVMAHGMGRQAIAEGVETVAHGSALLALGCTLGQGYGIARPMLASELAGWISAFERSPPWGRADPASS